MVKNCKKIVKNGYTWEWVRFVCLKPEKVV